jgi:hypothetical protein
MILDNGPTWAIVTEDGKSIATICLPEHETIQHAKVLVAALSGKQPDMFYLSHGDKLLLDSDLVSTVSNGEVVTLRDGQPTTTSDSISEPSIKGYSSKSKKVRKVHVPDEYISINQAIQALPRSGGSIEVLEEHLDSAEAMNPFIHIDRPNVCLYHPCELPTLHLPRHLVVLKNAINFTMINIEVDLLSDPFDNLDMTEMHSGAEMKSEEGLRSSTLIWHNLVIHNESMGNPQEKPPVPTPLVSHVSQEQPLDAPCHPRTLGEPIFASDSSDGSGCSWIVPPEDAVMSVVAFTGCSEGKAVRALQSAGGSTHFAANRILHQRNALRRVIASAPKPYEKCVMACDLNSPATPVHAADQAAGITRGCQRCVLRSFAQHVSRLMAHHAAKLC